MRTKKNREPYRIVDDAFMWHVMDGASDAEKRINSLLTCRYIFSKGVPSDECLSYAEFLVENRNDLNVDDIAEYVYQRLCRNMERYSPKDYVKDALEIKEILDEHDSKPQTRGDQSCQLRHSLVSEILVSHRRHEGGDVRLEESSRSRHEAVGLQRGRGREGLRS